MFIALFIFQTVICKCNKIFRYEYPFKMTLYPPKKCVSFEGSPLALWQWYKVVMPNMDYRADGVCVSHAYTPLGILEGPEMKGRARDMADGCKVSKKMEGSLGFILSF